MYMLSISLLFFSKIVQQQTINRSCAQRDNIEPLVLLLSEVAAFSQTGLATGWSAEDHVASSTHSSDLSVGEDGLKIHTFMIHGRLMYYRLRAQTV